VSLRGIILTRDTVHSNDMQCPFPSIPSGQMYVPRYGLISAVHASALGLGYCYLGNRSMVLTVQDILTADSVKMYLDFSTRTYPIGLLPGAVVTFRHLQQHISKQGLSISMSINPLSGSILPRQAKSSGIRQSKII
jgi:hypothetical protein